MVRLPAPPGAARRGALRGGAMKPSIVCGPPAFDRFLTGLTRSKAAVGAMGRLWRKIPWAAEVFNCSVLRGRLRCAAAHFGAKSDPTILFARLLAARDRRRCPALAGRVRAHCHARMALPFRLASFL